MTQLQNIQPSLPLPQEDPLGKGKDSSNNLFEDIESSASVMNPMALVGSFLIAASCEKADGQQSNFPEEKPNEIKLQTNIPAQAPVDISKDSLQIIIPTEPVKNEVDYTQKIVSSPQNHNNPNNKQPQVVQQANKLQPPVVQDEQCRLFINQRSKQQDSTPDKNQKKQVEFEEVVIIPQQTKDAYQTKPFTEVLLQRKQRLEERYKKSEKMRATIIKLTPIATKKESELKIALNTLKMTQTAQFLQSKGSENMQEKIPPSQWRQQKQSKQQIIKNLIANNSPPKKQSPSIPKFTGISPNKSKQQKSPSKQKKSPSLPKLQNKPPRMMPYNIYNLYQRKPEMFKLSSLATP